MNGPLRQAFDSTPELLDVPLSYTGRHTRKRGTTVVRGRSVINKKDNRKDQYCSVEKVLAQQNCIHPATNEHEENT